MKLLPVLLLSFLGIAFSQNEPRRPRFLYRRPLPVKVRIIGGQDADYGEVPFQVKILFPIDAYSICGGALISASHVLTAAHCTDWVEEVWVQVGSIYTSDDDEGIGQLVPKENIILHPDWNRNTSKGDISVLVVPQPFTLGPHVAVVPIAPSSTSEKDFFVGKTATISGYGSTNDDRLSSDILQVANVTIRPLKACDRFRNKRLDTSQLCSTLKVSGTCNGDSGGPLVVDMNGPTLIGLTSFGSPRCTRIGSFGVYTNVAFYSDWIKSVIS